MLLGRRLEAAPRFLLSPRCALLCVKAIKHGDAGAREANRRFMDGGGRR